MGNVGSCGGKFMADDGAVCIGITEYNGGIYNKNGIDFDKAFDY